MKGPQHRPAAAAGTPADTTAAVQAPAKAGRIASDPPPASPRPQGQVRLHAEQARRHGDGCLLGVDIGTTGSKAIAFSADGRPLARGYADYPLHTGPGGTAELDATAVMDALRHAIREAAAGAAAAGAGPILALAAAAQGEAVTPLDRRLHPLGRSIVTFDRRGHAGCAILREGGWEARAEQTGLPLSWIVTAAKLAALRRDEPETYRRAAHFLCYEDLLAADLTGRPTISDSLAQRTWLLDRGTRAWDAAAVADLDLKDRLAEVAPSGQVVGPISPRAAQAYGLPPTCRLVAGAHDQTAGLIGAGAILPGAAAHAIGTVDCVSVTLRDRPAGPLLPHGYGVGLHPLPGLAVTLAFGFGGGSLLAWARDLTGAADVGALLADLPQAPAEAFAVPFWSGSGTPDLDAEDRGALFGLTLETTRGELVAALLRGMAFESRRNLQVLQGLGVDVHELRLVGGGARDAGWSQLRADATGRAYIEMPVRDAGCLGAAVLAAVGIGMYRDVVAACDAMVRAGPRFEPHPGRASFYDHLFASYLAAVRAVRAARPQRE